MGVTSGNDPGTQSTLSEINVTPLVDVMLVLLTIFMVASSVETIQVAAEREQLLKEMKEEEEQARTLQKLEKLQEREEREETFRQRERRQVRLIEMQEERLKEAEEQLDDRSQNVPVDLPKTNSEAINLAEQQKMVVSLTREHVFYIGDTQVVSCRDPVYQAVPGRPLKDDELLPDSAWRSCLQAIGKKLTANIKLQADKECYLRADRKLDYGHVLSLMATIRKAGVTTFGLVAEEFEDSQTTPSPTP